MTNYIKLREMRIGDFTEQIKDIDRRDLLSLKNYLVTQIQQIESELHISEKHEDKNWVHRAYRAKTTIGAKVQAIQDELNMRNLEEKEKRMQQQKHFEYMFITAAKEILERDTYLSLVDRAKELVGEMA